MANIERIKVEARKEELEEQRENAAEITQKVEAISTSKKKMEDSDKLAKEALEKLQTLKVEMNKLQEQFDQLSEDPAVKKYLAKKGLDTLDKYASSDEYKDSDISIRYKELIDPLDDSRETLKRKVKTRSIDKKVLLRELDKEAGINQQTNEEVVEDESTEQVKKSNFRTRPFSQLQKEANEKIKEIPEKEIETLVNDLIESKKTSTEEYVGMLANLKNDGRKIITEEDILTLQKYGRMYYHTAEDMFIKKLNETCLALMERIAGEVYDNPDFEKWKVSTKESYIKDRKDLILEKIKIDLRESKGKIESKQAVIDNVIGAEEITKKLEATKPEIESLFSKVNNDLKTNTFYNWIEGFYASYGHYNGSSYDHKMHVLFKKTDSKQNPFSKYFSTVIDYGSNLGGGPRYNTNISLPNEKLIENISLVEQDEESTKAELVQEQTKSRTFSERNVFSRLANRAEGENINTKIKELEGKASNLAEIKKMLVSLADFTAKIDGLMASETLRTLRFDGVGSKPPETYSTSFIGVIDEYIKQINRGI